METRDPASATRRALVTGASSGLGAGLARALAREGYAVWLVARRAAQLEDEAAHIRDAGGTAHVLALDLGDADASHTRLSALDREVGGMDLVVANAGFAGGRAALPLTKMPWDDVHAILRINLAGAAATMMPFVPGMVARGRGQIVAISSLLANIITPRTPAYGASKAGMSSFFRAADMELRPRGVAVTVVEPGFMATPAAEGVTEPMPFILSVERSVAIIMRGIRKRRRYVRFPLALRLASGLSSLLPHAIGDPLVRWTMRER